jgi:hypothetical protein
VSTFVTPVHAAGPLRKRRLLWLGAGTAAVLVAAGLAVLTVPVPGLEGYLNHLAIERVRTQVACPGVLPRPPAVTVNGRLATQLLRGKLSDVRVSVPDATLNGVPHAAFEATLRGVTQPAPNRTHAQTMTAAITVGFANLPAPAATTYRRTADGGLTVSVAVPAEDAANVKAKLYLKMRLQGETVRSVPQQLKIFGRTVPAAQVAELTGGVRTQKLPPLPPGVTYTSVTPQRDGLHVALSGVATTALSTLPTKVGDRTVSYTAENGLLGIKTSAIGVPLTIFTVPRLGGGRLTLTPQSVRILGADRKTSDPLARLVLTQIDEKDLARPLPALPPGVRYRSAAVDAGGVKVTLGGVTIRPFSTLPQPEGRPTTFGAENGLLTATANGGSDQATPIVLYAQPRIRGTVLDIAPDQIEMFGARFPAANVLAEVKAQQTTFPLQKLSTGLGYRSVEVLDRGLRIRLDGRDVTMARGALTGTTC